MKIKCKRCYAKFNVASQSEIPCHRIDCPQALFSARRYEELEFKDFPKPIFEIVDEFNVPDSVVNQVSEFPHWPEDYSG